MMGRLTRNAVNDFTISYNQTVVEQGDFGTYHLCVSNAFGEITVFLNVIPQTKPDMPRNAKIVCETTGAKVQWISSFNGGDMQSFTVTTMKGQYKESESDILADKGENRIHSTYIHNLQPSTMYMFYVSARNRRGVTSSENISCTTLTEHHRSFSIITGSAAAGGITLAIVVIVVVVLLRRFKKRDNHERNSDRDNHMRTNEDASNYTTLAERQENGQMYESLKNAETTGNRNICDKQMIDKNPKDLSAIYVNHSVKANNTEYINLSFST
uniref:Fibronectin type-III domain-containing protein n=1 Tax=Magallana gigas TaxID=29159 RepID=A0A8W8LDI6_MAGGI